MWLLIWQSLLNSPASLLKEIQPYSDIRHLTIAEEIQRTKVYFRKIITQTLPRQKDFYLKLRVLPFFSLPHSSDQMFILGRIPLCMSNQWNTTENKMHKVGSDEAHFGKDKIKDKGNLLSLSIHMSTCCSKDLELMGRKKKVANILQQRGEGGKLFQNQIKLSTLFSPSKINKCLWWKIPREDWRTFHPKVNETKTSILLSTTKDTPRWYISWWDLLYLCYSAQ